MDSLELKNCFRLHEDAFTPFRGKSILLTGGTGFFGKWLLMAISFANREWGMGIKAASLSRRPETFLKEFREFAALSGVEFIAGDIRSFEVPGRNFDFVIHAAAEFIFKDGIDRPEETYSTIVEGTRHTLEVARKAGAKRLLYASSGAIYGQSAAGRPLAEDAPCLSSSAYGKGKLEAEALCQAETSFACPIARCFAFVGPYLPMDAHFAVGNFIRDAVSGREIVIKGDGSPVRSYMYAADLALWLLTLLARGEHGRPYNVGSDEAISIKSLAEKVARLAGRDEPFVKVLGESRPGAANSYLPDIARAKSELGLALNFDLDSALRATLAWAQQNKR